MWIKSSQNMRCVGSEVGLIELVHSQNRLRHLQTPAHLVFYHFLIIIHLCMVLVPRLSSHHIIRGALGAKLVWLG